MTSQNYDLKKQQLLIKMPKLWRKSHNDDIKVSYVAEIGFRTDVNGSDILQSNSNDIHLLRVTSQQPPGGAISPQRRARTEPSPMGSSGCLKCWTLERRVEHLTIPLHTTQRAAILNAWLQQPKALTSQPHEKPRMDIWTLRYNICN